MPSTEHNDVVEENYKDKDQWVFRKVSTKLESDESAQVFPKDPKKRKLFELNTKKIDSKFEKKLKYQFQYGRAPQDIIDKNRKFLAEPQTERGSLTREVQQQTNQFKIRKLSQEQILPKDYKFQFYQKTGSKERPIKNEQLLVDQKYNSQKQRELDQKMSEIETQKTRKFIAQLMKNEFYDLPKEKKDFVIQNTIKSQERFSIETVADSLKEILNATRPLLNSKIENNGKHSFFFVFEPVLQLMIQMLDSMFKLFNTKITTQKNDYEGKINELTKPKPKTIKEMHIDFLYNQIEEISGKLEKSHVDRRKLEKKLGQLQEKLDILMGESALETYPQMSNFCFQMQKYLNKSDMINNQQLTQLFGLQKLLNFEDPLKNKFMLKERLKKLKDVQTDDEKQRIPIEVQQYFEQDKLEVGREEVKCIFEFFDAQIMREFKKDRTLEKTSFTERVNSIISEYVNPDSRLSYHLKTHMISYLMSYSNNNTRQSNTKSRLYHLGNMFASKLLNRMISFDQRVQQGPYIHDEIMCRFMMELQWQKQEVLVHYQICADFDIREFLQYNHVYKCLKKTFQSLKIRKETDYWRKFLGYFMESLIILEAFGVNSSDFLKFSEQESFLDTDQLLSNINQNKNKLMLTAKDRVRVLIELEIALTKMQLTQKRASSKIDIFQSMDFESQISASPNRKIEQSPGGVSLMGSVTGGVGSKINLNMIEQDNDNQVIKQYYYLLMIKMMVYDPNMPRSMRKLFSLNGGNNKESLCKDSFRVALETGFKGYVTDFEIEFLLAYLPVSQIEKGNVSVDEKNQILKHIGDSEEQKKPESGVQIKQPRIYHLKHLQRDLHYIEDQNVLQSTTTNKLRVFNSLEIALSLDKRYFSIDRFNALYQVYDRCEASQSGAQTHLLHFYDQFYKLMNQYIFIDGGYYHDLSDQQRKEFISKQYLKMCQSHRFNTNNPQAFDKQALIQVLNEIRVFTGFQVKNQDLLTSSIDSVKKKLKRKQSESPKRSLLEKTESYQANQKVSAFSSQDNEILNKISFAFQRYVK
ncbi:UNKNOWN [Stylonychia lemnae]|uniref:Uncharacterized protein n=1 Tax=Stylonychia lemnae TaxID=5949 RepID=A0A077ZX88_STYLE|nr:UNKNOWN [Stylonychia lemnae]|eukprot:CDW74531.1 UNKNOWN [Stylonychia lemnae]